MVHPNVDTTSSTGRIVSECCLRAFFFPLSLDPDYYYYYYYYYSTNYNDCDDKITTVTIHNENKIKQFLNNDNTKVMTTRCNPALISSSSPIHMNIWNSIHIYVHILSIHFKYFIQSSFYHKPLFSI